MLLCDGMTGAMFPVVTVPEDAAEGYESLGSKPKFWYDNREYLFKETRADTGEDWAEKVVAYLCAKLGIPHAEYELAEWRGRRGVVTRRIHTEDERLFLGNELLVRIVPEYGNATTQRGGNSFHTLDNVLNCLCAYPPPTSMVLPDKVVTATHVFIAYLMLDTLIGNTDRHHENWGCIASSNGTNLRLAPTYDHASSLGREHQDKRREAMLTTRDVRADVEAYARRGTSVLYESPLATRPMFLRDCFRAATTLFPDATHEWLSRLANLTEQDVEVGFRQIPEDRISEWGIKFGVALVQSNRNWLLSTE